ncbi:hypothetical protein FSP39_014535 [Pinctada imbricata]|uniref:Uncharacterized protein n=1 Tax=Pinctada imbricata TaxID=66713 RepID=A0AA88Y8Y1_PINIB|nr:hypothetical protein FSP39_014535 [Pinctada imbricata]
MVNCDFSRWWRRPNCPDPRSSAKSKAIDMQVASGMFYVLSGGVALAGIVFVIEYIFNDTICMCPKRRKRASHERDENNIQNHVASNSSNFLEKDTELRTVLSRTLSIGENSLPHRWENEAV